MTLPTIERMIREDRKAKTKLSEGLDINQNLHINRIEIYDINSVMKFLGCVKTASYILHDGFRYSTHYFNKYGLEIAYNIRQMESLTILSEPREWGTYLMNSDDYQWSKIT